jgi:hypothetical protein
MKLYNNTAVPDAILAPVIREAAKAIKPRVRHGKVIIIVNRAQRACSGLAHKCIGITQDVVRPRSKRAKKISKQWRTNKAAWVSTDKGYLILRLPKASDHATTKNANHPLNAMQLAERFYDLCLHEWGHILDYQKGKSFGHYNKQWANRPHERRAEHYRNEARERGMSQDAQEAIIDLAVHLEAEVKSTP